MTHNLQETQLDAGNSKGSATTWLADVLTPGAKALYAEEETACLRFLKGTQCKCDPTDPTCKHQLQINEWGCCHEDEAGEHLFLQSPSTVGTCTWEMHYANPPTAMAPNIDLYGNATITCELNRNADECGSPLCDGLKIRSSGNFYYIYDTPEAPLYTRGPAAPYTGVVDPDCGTASPRMASRKAKKVANRPQASGGADAAGYYRGEPDFTAYYPTGEVDVFIGTFNVVSPRHHDRPLTGRMQISNPYYGSTPGAPPVYTLPAKAMAFNPWALELKFDAHDHHY